MVRVKAVSVTGTIVQTVRKGAPKSKKARNVHSNVNSVATSSGISKRCRNKTRTHQQGRRNGPKLGDSLETDGTWNIEAVVYGDGTVGTSGVQLQKGVLYGSAVMTGRHENFHAIDDNSVCIVQIGKRPRSFHTRPLNKGNHSIPKRCLLPKPAQDDGKTGYPSEAMELMVLNFFRHNPGVVVLIGGPGARESDPRLENYRLANDDSVIATSSELDCVAASVVYAVGRFRNQADALRVKGILLKDNTHYQKLGQLGDLFDRLGINCRIEKPSKSVRNNKIRDRHGAVFKWLAEEASGIWLVRLVQPNVVDHCIAIDTGSRMILDSEEDHPLRFNNPDVLQMCGGPKGNKVKVAELFRLTQASSKAKH